MLARSLVRSLACTHAHERIAAAPKTRRPTRSSASFPRARILRRAESANRERDAERALRPRIAIADRDYQSIDRDRLGNITFSISKKPRGIRREIPSSSSSSSSSSFPSIAIYFRFSRDIPRQAWFARVSRRKLGRSPRAFSFSSREPVAGWRGTLSPRIALIASGRLLARGRPQLPRELCALVIKVRSASSLAARLAELASTICRHGRPGFRHSRASASADSSNDDSRKIRSSDDTEAFGIRSWRSPLELIRFQVRIDRRYSTCISYARIVRIELARPVHSAGKRGGRAVARRVNS